MHQIINNIRKELEDISDETIRNNQNRFFKEEVKVYGTKTATVIAIGKRYLKELTHLSKNELFELCEILWESGMMEEQFIACDWAYSQRKNYKPEDFEIFDRWVSKYVSNWATCDTLCNHTIGTFIEMYPDYIEKLKDWAKNGNRWKQRASAVTLIVPARKGLFREAIFELATILLHSPDDMVQKGYGWMLKVSSQSRHTDVFDFIMKHKQTMPRTAFRYALEKMPAELRNEAMKRTC